MRKCIQISIQWQIIDCYIIQGIEQLIHHIYLTPCHDQHLQIRLQRLLQSYLSQQKH